VMLSMRPTAATTVAAPIFVVVRSIVFPSGMA
jgi:hypothetical protein